MSARPAASRRTVLRGVALTPVAGLGLTACGGTTDDSAAPLTEPVELGPESEVAEDGAKLYRDHNVVVSRSGDGTLKAYNTVCTHAGCPINKLDGTKLVCPCHGSEFDATTGKVLREPAVAPLKPLTVEVKNGTLVAGPQV
ncbi:MULTISPECIES: Rieske (2Fe-2S) protein [Streptomyces]|jgi:nitrite reductase/ring-hydroxylating ferredoxin subunit|uniref:Cytochrome bc1 complex Rieske iron-sulfur subunit n=1 Tax=Streptomyces griseoflavus Tu4000 TaxID=467200 RepID=D9XQ82_9ACTN|nr:MULTISPECIES: Rieske (2Fe-2S) protein [Streptomyces]EFL41965.1 iron sulfur binding protein [Streptomyces griseoflavus Tu4000]QKV99865.1 Rieske (2Fe-2S) protein [Streptomyces sp. NA02536]TQL23150.1 nitrite reductase/ring-hydroxylating ferredoxin subunit [Streptomyces sp. SLBN-134]